MDTAEIEAMASLRHALTLLYNSETLGEREALETLSIKIYIVKDLTARRLLNKGRREGPHKSFDLSTEMDKAIRMGSPNNGHDKRAKSEEM